MVRVALATGIVAVLAGALLARVPFHDGEVRCGAPISGAVVSEDEAMEDANLLSSCDDAGAGRVLVAGGLVFAGLVVMLAGLSVGEVRALGGSHRLPSALGAPGGHAGGPHQRGRDERAQRREDSRPAR